MDFKTFVEVVSVCCDVIDILRRLSKWIAKSKTRKTKKKYRPTLPKH